MATKNDVIVENPSDLFSVPGDDDESPDVALMNALAEIGASEIETKVAVYRATPEKGMKGGAFLFSCSPAEFSLEYLRDSYGGGTYRIHIRQGARLVGNRIVTIEEPRKPSLAMMPPQSPSLDLGKMIDAMQAGFNGLGQMILNANKAPAVDPDAMRRGMMQDMLTMKELFSGNKADNGEGAIAMLLKGMEIARDITPRGDGETGTADILMEAMKTFGKPIAEAAMAARAQQPSAPVQLPVMPAQQGQIATQPQLQPQPQPQEDEMSLMLRYYAAQLLDQAANDRDPYVYANLLVDNLPDDKINELMALPDLKEFLYSLNAGLKNHSAWVDEFINYVKELLTPESEGDSVGKHENPPNDPGKLPNA